MEVVSAPASPLSGLYFLSSTYKSYLTIIWDVHCTCRSVVGFPAYIQSVEALMNGTSLITIFATYYKVRNTDDLLPLSHINPFGPD